MSSEKTDAIVIRVVEFSETSCIVTMLTRDFGKVTAIAKGARRPKSPFDAAIDVLAICRIVFIPKTNAMGLLTEAKLEHRFRAGEWDLNRLYIGYYIIELLRILTDDEDPQPELYQLAYEMIRDLDSEDLTVSELKTQLIQFELGVLDILGHLPMLTRCVECGREKTQLTKVNFGLNAGGVLCHDCRKGQSNIITISESGFELLLALVGGQIGKQQENSDNWNQPDRVNESRLRGRSWSRTRTSPASYDRSLASQPTEFNKMIDFEGKNRNSPEPNPLKARMNDDSLNTNAGSYVINSHQHPTLELNAENVVRSEDEKANPTEDEKDPLIQLAEIRRLINQYITHLTGYPPRLQKFLQN